MIRIKKIPFLFLGLLFTLASCNKDSLDPFAEQEPGSSIVSIGSVTGNSSKTNEMIHIPVSISLSSPAVSAFEVYLRVNNDTLSNLPGNIVPDDAVILSSGNFAVPKVLTVPYGADKMSFEVAVGVSTVENYYGKKLALAVSLSSATKGNSISRTGNTGVIVLNTPDLIKVADIHYLSITNGGGTVLQVQHRQNYSVTSLGFSIPLGITLKGEPGSFFTVKAKVNTDTIATLVENGVLPEGTVSLQEDQYIMDTVITVKANTSSANLVLNVPESVIRANIDKKLALAVSLADPSRHVLDKAKSTVIVLIYPDRVVETDITNQGTLTVNHENSGGPTAGEGSPKLVDGNSQTKYLFGNFAADAYMQLTFPEPLIVGAYTMTAANDSPTRDPKDWNLAGSNDGVNWKVLDRRSGATFERFETKRYEFDNSTAYLFYRLNITANATSSNFQMAEWRLISLP